MLRRWVRSYQVHGAAGLRHSPRHYDSRFKLAVLRRMWREGLSFGQTALLFDIRNASHLKRWEEQYHAGGSRGLVPRPGGRPAAMTVTKPPKPKPSGAPDEERSREELLKELEYLRAENAYLKKLDALIQAKKAAARKPRS